MTRCTFVLLFSFFFVTNVLAAVTPNSVITPQTPNRGIVQFLQGTDTAGVYKTLYTAGVNGSKCVGMLANTNDATNNHLTTVQLVNATVKYGGVAVLVLANAGFSNTVTGPLDLMAAWSGLPRDSDNNPVLLLVNGDTLQATFATALATSSVLNIQVFCYDF